ncbi:MAG: hypothetical protein J7L47_02300 [Candidatus Odinarchaeota archaeon]|nr:hypothetical protein [Candidatus Odinarchaeota archaeon]
MQKLKMTIARAILVFLIVDSTFLLATHMSSFVPYVVETIIIGVPVWLIFGALAPKIITSALRKNSSEHPGGLYLLDSLQKEKPRKTRALFAMALDYSISPTLFMFGVLNVIVNHFSFVLSSYGTLLFMFLLTFGLGVVFPIIYILRDSNLIVVDSEHKVIQPIGVGINRSLNSVSGVSAFLGFLYTVFAQSFDAFSTFIVLLAVTTVVYPPLLVILLFYTYKHLRFVEKTNSLLSKKFKKCRIVIETSVQENSIFQLLNNNT